LYHWTHLELQRYFNITDILDSDTAQSIYDNCSDQLRTPDFSIRQLLRRMNVRLVCTTDDPIDSLQFHQKLKADGFEIPILPAFRPDHAMNVSNADRFIAYIRKLEAVSDITISTFNDFLQALKSRHDYFADNGCTVSDHGLEQVDAEDFTIKEIESIFNSIHSGKELKAIEQKKFRSAMLLHFAEWDWEKGWTQQFHLGALRNNNTRMLRTLGPDTGWDSIGDFSQAGNLSRFLDNLDVNNKLAKTILYNLNPSDNELMATMIGNFNDGSSAGKIQWGSSWWFMDQKDGMTRQINTLSNMGLISRFVGMLTDSRSFLSFPRHEYFRRILCDLFGDDMENGELPGDIKWVGKIIQDICFNNNNNYFNWQLDHQPSVANQ
ncbi:MAG: glucuronate isomerase, partial [Chitinophagaceae bacterium]